MATAALPDDEFYASNDDKLLEIFCLIWLDANPEENRNTDKQLRSIINQLKRFQDVKQCQKYIEKTSQKDRLVLIVSGQMGREIVPSIHKLRQVISIYVYCMDKKRNEEWTRNYKKIKAVIVDLDELISQIKRDYKIQTKVDEPLSINIFTSKSTMGVNGEFVFSQVLIDCLIRLKSTKTDVNELISICKNQYKGNSDELDNIREFKEDYSSNNVLWWYTRESFFYKTLNAALRAQNIHVIFLFRTYILDIHRQLQKYQSKKPLRVYRSQMMSTNELKTLRKSLDQFISINSFFSTSTNHNRAMSFLSMADAAEDLEKVLFQIDADPKTVTTKPFADISKHSVFSDEAEVLFMLGSIFRLQSIDRDDNEIWIIRMVLCKDDEHELEQVLMYMKQQTGDGETNLRTFGKVLWKMGKLDLAEKYFTRLLEELPANSSLLASLYEDLGELISQMGNYDMSVEWHKKALILKNNQQPPVDLNPKKTTKPNAISSTSRITNNTRWKQHGNTVAGGNGRGNKLNQLHYPFGLSIDNERQSIYITDYRNHRIVEWKFNAKSGQVIAGRNGQRNQLYQPTDVLVDTKNNSLIICDQGNRRVVEWSRQNGTTNGHILISDIDCSGITMDKNGYIYVSECMKDEVRRWNRGETNGVIMAGGNGKGDHLNQLNYPTYLFVDQDDSLYVSDCHNHRVMKWMKNAKEGIIVAGGQKKGDQLTQLSYPKGVIVDHLDNIYIADDGNDRIMCWSKGSKQGRIIVGGNGRGEQSNQLNDPVGISFDREDNLYVVDWGNDRVQKYEIEKY